MSEGVSSPPAQPTPPQAADNINSRVQLRIADLPSRGIFVPTHPRIVRKRAVRCNSEHSGGGATCPLVCNVVPFSVSRFAIGRRRALNLSAGRGLRIEVEMEPKGFHHLTAVSADARGNLAFYAGTLGMRLVKKTVNQDDVSAYHLFYADGRGTPGTDITFFDWPSPRERRGTNSIVRTGFRVGGEDSLGYWLERLQSLGVRHGQIVARDGRATLDFEDPEGQRLSLAADDGGEVGYPWEKSPVPAEHQIRGLGPITLSVPDSEPTEDVLTRVMNMR